MKRTSRNEELLIVEAGGTNLTVLLLNIKGLQ
jgi:hexokinase